jgi:hypothetical protein
VSDGTRRPPVSPEYALVHGETVLGIVRVTGAIQPFWLGTFDATEAFAAVRLLFEEELRLLTVDGDQFDGAGYEEAYGRILALGLRLVPPDGEALTDFLLHIDGGEAWFRY